MIKNFIKNKKNLVIILSLLIFIPSISFGGYFLVKKQIASQKNLSELEKITNDQQNRIAELEKAKEEEKRVEQEKIAEEQRKKEEMETLKNEQSIQAEALKKCKDFQSACNSKINPILMEISSAKDFIKARERDIETRNDIIDDCSDDVCKKPYEDAIKAHKKLIKEKEEEIENLENKYNKLISGECKNYKTLCN